MIPSQRIREIWQEMKELKRMRDGEVIPMESIKEGWDRRKAELERKYQEVEILFGHESTLNKATVYFLDERYKKQQEIIKQSNQSK